MFSIWPLLRSEFLCLPPKNSYVEVLIPKLMVFGGEALGEWLGYKGGTLMFEICASIKEVLQSYLSLLPCEETMTEVGSPPSRRGPSSKPNNADVLISKLWLSKHPASKIMRSTYLLFMNYPVCSVLLSQPQRWAVVHSLSHWIPKTTLQGKCHSHFIGGEDKAYLVKLILPQVLELILKRLELETCLLVVMPIYNSLYVTLI